MLICPPTHLSSCLLVLGLEKMQQQRQQRQLVTSGMCPREKRSLKPIFLISALQRRMIWILLARRAIKTLVDVNPLERLGGMFSWVKRSDHNTGLGNPHVQMS